MQQPTPVCSDALFQRVLALCHTLSDKAADIIRDVYKSGDLGVVGKGEEDFCTRADRLAQRCIVSSLQRSFPRLTVTGEETLDATDVVPEEEICTELSPEVMQQSCPPDLRHVKEDEIVVWVDPLDGTSDFKAGRLANVTVLIGLAVKGVAKAGVINQPYYKHQEVDACQKPGRCVWGIVGLGSFGHERGAFTAGENVITTAPTTSDPVINRAVTSCKPTREIRTGAPGMKMLLTLERQAHAYVYASGHRCCKWDTCGPEAVLRAAGGCVTDILGVPIPYQAGVDFSDKTGILATAPGVDHAWYVDNIPEDVREQFRDV